MTRQEHQARRYQQVASLERSLQLKLTEIAQAKEHVKELSDERDGILSALRAAARDEGDLPLPFASEDDYDTESAGVLLGAR